ncbi:MAG: SCO family protein [Gammaproteobacteria bacterium]|nr:SCO family protein [Gammaproteobacteria bacterium]MDH5652905.1 SCO family protein [Gammaproteobacteria bacterium]
MLYRIIPFSLILGVLATAASAEDDPHAHHRQHAKQKVESAALATVNLSNTSLVNQHGKTVGLKDDVIGKRIAVVTFAYTTCTTVCPVVSAIFSQVNKKLAGHVGKDVELVTITVDPNRDTPARLLAYSKKHGAGDGWSWLTGKKDNVIQALNTFGAYTVNFEDHPAMVLVGDAENNKWYRFYGFASPDVIADKVRELLKQRKQG